VMRVPVGDFRIGEEERRIINDVLDSGRITEGERVREFEKKVGKFHWHAICHRCKFWHFRFDCRPSCTEIPQKFGN